MSVTVKAKPVQAVALSGWRASRAVRCAMCRVRLDEHVAAHLFRVPRGPA